MNQYAGPDDQVETVAYCPAKKRPGMSLDLFSGGAIKPTSLALR